MAEDLCEADVFFTACGFLTAFGFFTAFDRFTGLVLGAAAFRGAAFFVAFLAFDDFDPAAFFAIVPHPPI